MSKKLMSTLRNLASYLKIADALPQLRRYVVLGVFDGLLVALSIITASHIKSQPESILWTMSLSSLIAVSVASAWNTLQAEIFEKTAEIRRIERVILRPLRGTVLDKAHKVSIVICSIVHALSPLVGLVLVAIYTVLLSTIHEYALHITVIIASVMLALLGLMYLRELAKKEVAKLSLLMSLAATFLIIILVLTLHFV